MSVGLRSITRLWYLKISIFFSGIESGYRRAYNPLISLGTYIPPVEG